MIIIIYIGGGRAFQIKRDFSSPSAFFSMRNKSEKIRVGDFYAFSTYSRLNASGAGGGGDEINKNLRDEDKGKTVAGEELIGEEGDSSLEELNREIERLSLQIKGDALIRDRNYFIEKLKRDSEALSQRIEELKREEERLEEIDKDLNKDNKRFKREDNKDDVKNTGGSGSSEGGGLSSGNVGGSGGGTEDGGGSGGSTSEPSQRSISEDFSFNIENSTETSTSLLKNVLRYIKEIFENIDFMI